MEIFDAIAKMEPQADLPPLEFVDCCQASMAISLKRIADFFEVMQAQFEAEQAKQAKQR